MKRGFLNIFCAALALLVSSHGVASVVENDVRVLMDVSGSMKQNDPHNLRQPALRMLSELLPSGTRAGVWTFGRYVNMQVKLGTVDDGWKQRAQQGASELHSRGLFTNIEGAIERASRGWVGNDAHETNRSLILLTDGVVDISPDDAKNAASRARILDKWLPALTAAGVRIYTVALSQNTDTELLSTLAEESEGWFEQTVSAEGLQRAFLRMFDKSVKADTLPLEGNRFTVDGSIRELTLLAFKADPNDEIAIRVPGDPTKRTANDAPETFGWVQEQAYELITVVSPAQGEWEIIGAEDPDNRVVVVTDLKMRVADLPNRLLPGTDVDVRVSIEQEGERITRPDFLNLVSVGLSVSSDGVPATEVIALNDTGANGDVDASDGEFGVSLPALTDGIHTLSLVVDGGTFARAFEHRVAVEWPISYKIVDEAEGQAPVLKITPLTDRIEIKSLLIDAWVEDAAGNTTSLSLRSKGFNGWSVTLDQLDRTQNNQIHLRANGRTVDGENFDYVLAPIEVAANKPAVDPKSDQTNAAEKSVVDEKINWLIVGLIAGVALLAAIVIGLVVWLIVSRKNSQSDVGEDDDEDGSDSTIVDDREEVVDQAAEVIAETEAQTKLAQEPEETAEILDEDVTDSQTGVTDFDSKNFNDYENQPIEGAVEPTQVSNGDELADGTELWEPEQRDSEDDSLDDGNEGEAKVANG
ncbi:MAG: vWA domain-containing protein [Pseudomonadota bacterium]